jgi:hypothetical protein
MRYRFLVLLLFWLLPSMAAAQTSAVGDPGSSRITTLVGAGNSFSGIGVLADIRPFARGPLSLMLSVGSTKAFFDVQHTSVPWMDESVATIAAAVGVRATAGHGQHQGFLELAFLPVDDDVVEISAAGPPAGLPRPGHPHHQRECAGWRRLCAQRTCHRQPVEAHLRVRCRLRVAIAPPYFPHVPR